MPPRRRLHDEYFNRAKSEGYLARSAYKLVEINERKKLLRRGMAVLDLGCAPGAWLQVAEKRIGPGGAAVGIDLTPVRHPFGPNVRTLTGDVNDIEPADLLRALAAASGEEDLPDSVPPRRFDVILSDMAPSTSGAGGGSSDHFLSIRLCDRVLDLCTALLNPGGSVAMKAFEGEAYPDLLARAGDMFAQARGFKPKASRDVSREMYVICHRFQSVL